MDENDPVNSRESQEPVSPLNICLNCRLALAPQDKFCAHCGLESGKPPSPKKKQPSPLQIRLKIDRDISLLKNIIILFVILVATNVIGSWIYQATDKQVLVGFFMEAIDSAAVILWLFAFSGKIIELYSLRKLFCGWGKYLVPLVASVPIYAVVHFIVYALTHYFKLEDYAYTGEYYEAGYGFLAVLISICLQPAVIEEMAFRGIIQTNLRKFTGNTEALIVTSAAFAILHFSTVSFVHLFLLGMYLGWLRNWSKSIYPPMIAHFLHNLLVILNETYSILPV
jgi:membrane protease YdiL (CAAX protease family)